MKNGLVVKTNGDKCWYKDDKLHRTDGPAVERANGRKYWYINGKEQDRMSRLMNSQPVVRNSV